MTCGGRQVCVCGSLADLSPAVRRVLGTEQSVSGYLRSQRLQTAFQSLIVAQGGDRSLERWREQIWAGSWSDGRRSHARTRTAHTAAQDSTAGDQVSGCDLRIASKMQTNRLSSVCILLPPDLKPSPFLFRRITFTTDKPLEGESLE